LPEDLIADAESWLEQRGVPHFVLATKDPRDPEAPDHRLAHAVVAMALAAGFGAATADAAWLAHTALPLAYVLVPFVADVGRRRLKRWQGRFRYPRPSHMTVAALVGIAVAATADAMREDHVIPTFAIAVGFALVMLAVAAATPWGLLLTARWAIAHPFRELRHNAKVVAGALPLLLLTVAFLFMTTEIWEVAAYLTVPELAGMVGMFVALGLCFLLVLARSRVSAAQCFVDWEHVYDAMAHERPEPIALDVLETTFVAALQAAPSWQGPQDAQTWLAELRHPSGCDDDPAEPPPRWWRKGVTERAKVLRRLRRRIRETGPCEIDEVRRLEPAEHWNITLVLLFGQIVQVAFVTVLMAAFLLAFGWLAVDHGTLGAWGVSSEHLWRELTEEHVKVTVLLAAFSGLSYAVSAALLPEQRDYFFGELDRKTTQRLAVRALYRGLKHDL
jgi:hypothetical protein